MESDAISGFVFLVGGTILGAARYASGIDRINVRGRDRNREAKTRRRRKGIRKTGKGKNNRGRVKWTSIYVRQEGRWADDDVTSKQGASHFTLQHEVLLIRSTTGLNIQNGRTLALHNSLSVIAQFVLF